MKHGRSRRIARWWLVSAAGVLTGCGRAPSFDILGSFFPAWLVCLAVGLLLTVVARWLLLRLQIVVALPILTYPSLTALLHVRAVARLLSIARELLMKFSPDTKTGKVIGKLLSVAIVAGAIRWGWWCSLIRTAIREPMTPR